MVKMPEDFEPILKHIQKYFGQDGFLIQNTVHDVSTKILVAPPNKGRRYALFITIGMSERPMFELPDFNDLGAILSGNREKVRGAFKNNYAEMLIKLPPDWPIPSLSRGLKNDDYFWPIQRLFELVDYVHEESTYFSHGHTFGYDKNFTFANNTKLAGWFFIHPPYLSKQFAKLKVNQNKIISFLQLIPLYLEEILFAEENGSEKLLKKFQSYNISDYISFFNEVILYKFTGKLLFQ